MVVEVSVGVLAVCDDQTLLVLVEAFQNIGEDVAVGVIDDFVLARLSLLFLSFAGALLSDGVDKTLGEELLDLRVNGGVGVDTLHVDMRQPFHQPLVHLQVVQLLGAESLYDPFLREPLAPPLVDIEDLKLIYL